MKEFETNKKLIKNGMTFLYGSDYYLKVGGKCVKINLQDINNNILFKDVDENEIKCIFKSNGYILTKQRMKG